MAKVPTSSTSIKSSPFEGVIVALTGILVIFFLFRYAYYSSSKDVPIYTLSWLPGIHEHSFNLRSWNDYWNENLLVSAAVLLWIPLMVISVASSKSFEDFGLAKGEKKTVWLWTGLLYGLMLIPVIVAARLPSLHFQEYYPINAALHGSSDLRNFVYFEIIYGFYLFCWEFFFRGFLTFGLRPFIGSWAILAQAVGFTLLHIHKPPAELFGSFIAAVVLGFIAYRAKSFLPAFWAHWAVAVTMDVLVVMGKH